MPTTITPNPTDLREPVYDVEEIFNETGCPDSAAAVVAIVAPMKPRGDAATKALQKVAKAPVSARTKRRAQELLRKK